MPERVSHVPEILMMAMMAVASFVFHGLMAIIPTSEREVYAWTLMPLIGSLFGGLIAYGFNPRNESRRIICSRVAFCVAVGVIGARLMTYAHPKIKELFTDPLILMGAGLLNGGFGFILSLCFVRGAYARAPRVAEEQLDVLEKRITGTTHKTSGQTKQAQQDTQKLE